MRRSILALGLAAAALTLAGCGTFGQPSTFTLAELNQRCEARGGALAPTGNVTGEARKDYACREGLRASPPNPGLGQLNQATDRALRQ